MSRLRTALFLAIGLPLAMVAASRTIRADEPVTLDPVTLETVSDPGPNRLDEPLAESFSMPEAAKFLDSAALTWQKQRKCFTCHTNYAYLYARPAISAKAPAHQEVRAFAEQLVMERWEKQGPRWDAEVVATAAALAFNDAATTGRLHKATRTALDRMWTVQREDGGWSWLNCNWPPMEIDDHYGATLAAIAVGAAPGDYKQTELARKGLAGIRKFLQATPPKHLHHQAMILWAATYHTDLMTKEQRQACIDKLSALQHSDGGWSAASLGNWQRADGSPQDTKSSDGYGTGFVVYVLRQAGVPAEDARLKRGVAWLKSHQRASGRWIARSLNRDSRHYLSHAGSAFAVMAITACEAK